MSIQSEITRITSARDSSFAAVEEKGVTVSAESTIDDLPTLIRSIQVGGDYVSYAETQSLTSAQQETARTNIGAGTYSKPSGGIPDSDIASASTWNGKQDTLTAGNGINITSDVISNTQGIEYIVGTQKAATNAWTGVSTDSTLKTGKIIAYKLPYAGTSSAATLNLTLANGTKTGAKALRRTGSSTVTTHFAVNNVIVMIYDGTYWRISAYYDSNNNTIPTGYCTTAAATAAKSATCTYGYRDDTNYFPCLFRYANTASNATLAIGTYADTALPIYVNGARTTSSNTFGAGVILFLYYNNAYYCYNDGRLPIVVNGTVTSVQDELALYTKTSSLATVATSGSYNDLTNKPTIPSAVTEATVSGWGFTKNTGTYSKPSTGIPKTDLASAVQTSLGKADTALQSFTETDPVFTASDAYGITSTDITNWNNKSNFSGSYTDLTNKPTIPIVPTNLSSFTDDLGSSPTHTHSQYAESANLATVATSGNYNDLSNTPTIHSIPSGGTSGQVLAKLSATDYDVGWVNQSGGGGSSLIVENVSITTSDWTQDSTYADFPNKAVITVTGATSNMYPEVVFSPSDACSGYYAPVATSATNSVIIYAKQAGAVAMTIPTVIVR